MTSNQLNRPNPHYFYLHHDNAPPHASLLIHESLAKQETIVVPQPPTLQIFPCGLFPVPKLKSTLKGRHFRR